MRYMIETQGPESPNADTDVMEQIGEGIILQQKDPSVIWIFCRK